MQKAETVRIRPFQPSDHEFVTSLISRFSEFELPKGRRKQDVDDTNRMTLQKAMEGAEPGSMIFIAEDVVEGLSGFIHLQTQIDYFNGEKHGYISDLAVEKHFEGRGIGRMLLETAEAWAREKGFNLLALYVFAGNTRAQHLYEKYGFQQEVVKYVKAIEQNS